MSQPVRTNQSLVVAQHAAYETAWWRDTMRLGDTFVADINCLNADRYEHVGDQAAVTAPPEKLRAHHRRSKPVREHQQLEQALGEFFGCDVVGVRAKAGVTPRDVDRVGIRPSSSTETRQPTIEDSVALQIASQRVLAEL